MTNSLTAYTMILLRSNHHYLMLHRSSEKHFAPGRWTGIGGRVEQGEFDNLHAAALREIAEETGISASAIHRFTLRRALLQHRHGYPLTTLLYFTGDLNDPVTPDCPEGTLHWLTAEEISNVDVIENTAEVIPFLIGDMERNPDGASVVITGAIAFTETGSLGAIVWSS